MTSTQPSTDPATVLSLASIPPSELASLGISHAQAGLALIRAGNGDDVGIEPYIRPDAGFSLPADLVPGGIKVYDSTQPIVDFSAPLSVSDTHQLRSIAEHPRLLKIFSTLFAPVPGSSEASGRLAAAFASLYNDTAIRTEDEIQRQREWSIQMMSALYDQARVLDGPSSKVSRLWESMCRKRKTATHVEVLDAFAAFLTAQSQEVESRLILHGMLFLGRDLRETRNDPLGALVSQAGRLEMARKLGAEMSTTRERKEEFAKKWTSLHGSAEVPEDIHQYASR